MCGSLSECTCGNRNWAGEIMLLNFSIGYFVFDLLITGYLGTINSKMVFSHTACIVGMIAVLITDKGGNFAVMGMLNLSIPKILMKIRAILRHLGMRQTLIHERIHLGYLALYPIFTFSTGLYITY